MFILGCSGAGINPLTPADPGEVIPDIATGNPDPVREPVSERVLWGLWNVTFDPATMEIGIAPIREPQAHFNVTNMILPPACNDCFAISVNSFDPVTHILDVDVTLRNPTPIGGYDVRGILHTNDYGHLLTNPDDWTEYWDMPGGGDINPFIAFAKDQPLRMFAGNTSHEENFQVFIPTPPAYFAITFAVDASFPTNCAEPYTISDFVQDGTLYQFNTATVDLFVAVHDWQGDVNTVKLSSSEIIGGGFLDFELLAGPVWRATLTNTEGAPVGEYEVIIQAESGTPPSIPLYDYFTVTVSETTDPVVVGIEPGTAERDESLNFVTVVGDNFIAPANITLQPATGPLIGVVNLVVQNENLITLDINIPIDAELGLYDLVLSNGDGKEAVGEDLFEVFNPTPTVNSIDPNSGDAGESLVDVTIGGEFFHGPAVVEFIMPPSDLFTADNVVVVDMNNITCDVDIPFTTDIGDYDVKITNADSKFAVGEDLFEVLCPVTTVTGIDPDTAELGESLTGVEITGTNFYGSSAVVKLRAMGEPDIVASNVVVLSPTSIGCDIDIPWGASTGLYNVEVTNGCGVVGVGIELVEIVLTEPFGWARTWGGIGWDEGYCVAVDDAGNAYVVGNFEGAVDFDPGPGVQMLLSLGEEDIFLCKYNNYGILVLAVSWGGGGYDDATAVALDGMGNVYVVGGFTGTADFDPGDGTEYHSANGSYMDAFLSVFDSDGNFQRAAIWGGTEGDWPSAVALDGSYNIYIAGDFRGTTDLDPDPVNTDNHPVVGQVDVFLMKLDANCDFVWGHTWGGSDYDWTGNVSLIAQAMFISRGKSLEMLI